MNNSKHDTIVHTEMRRTLYSGKSKAFIWNDYSLYCRMIGTRKSNAFQLAI